ncbi:MAG: YeiH family protein [Parvularculaceae bacterium]
MRGLLLLFGRRKLNVSWFDRAEAVAPGVMVATVIAMAARFLSEHYGGPAMLYALLFGIAFHFLNADPKFSVGVDFSTKRILRLGVALLGARITLGQIAALGWSTALLVALGVALTILLGWRLGKMFKIRTDHALLSAGAVAICGASAAMAISAVLPKREGSEANTILTVVGVTTMSTLAMILYPYLAHLFAFDDREAGVFLGGAIHDVAQVVGAGYMISDIAGENATIVKLMRVACLAPVVLAIGYFFREENGAESRGGGVGLPGFLIGFLAIVAVNSLNILPQALFDLAAGISSWFIIIAVAALGVKTSLADLIKVGPAPVAAMAAQTALLAVFVLAWLLIERMM